MSEYGQVINPQYDPSKNYIYEAFYEYFGDPVVTKIKNVHTYSVYMCHIHAMLGKSYRYLILFLQHDNFPNGIKKRMNECEWVSLQTRTLEDKHDLKPHSYQTRVTPELSKKINITHRDEKQSTYSCEDYPITVTLLHTRKNNKYQYQPTGTIVSALETFQTIINFTN